LLGALEGEVVEIGPGPGVNLEYYRSSVRWTGIEPNNFLHERIRQRASGLGIPARLSDAPAEHLDLPDRSVDAVVGTLVLCSVGDAARALAEVLRVLKPGGRYVFIEHVAAPVGSRTRRVQETWTPILRRLPGGCSPNRETRDAIGRAGFGAVSGERFELPTSFGIALPHIAGIATKWRP
jgi:ubiquinone/menaquinone biosynthesis C-methylase UbiE